MSRGIREGFEAVEMRKGGGREADAGGKIRVKKRRNKKDFRWEGNGWSVVKIVLDWRADRATKGV
jgi:hypothetical protein